jgi:hypothetical protein
MPWLPRDGALNSQTWLWKCWLHEPPIISLYGSSFSKAKVVYLSASNMKLARMKMRRVQGSSRKFGKKI